MGVSAAGERTVGSVHQKIFYRRSAPRIQQADQLAGLPPLPNVDDYENITSREIDFVPEHEILLSRYPAAARRIAEAGPNGVTLVFVLKEDLYESFSG